MTREIRARTSPGRGTAARSATSASSPCACSPSSPIERRLETLHAGALEANEGHRSGFLLFTLAEDQRRRDRRPSRRAHRPPAGRRRRRMPLFRGEPDDRGSPIPRHDLGPVRRNSAGGPQQPRCVFARGSRAPRPSPSRRSRPSHRLLTLCPVPGSLTRGAGGVPPWFPGRDPRTSERATSGCSSLISSLHTTLDSSPSMTNHDRRRRVNSRSASRPSTGSASAHLRQDRHGEVDAPASTRAERPRCGPGLPAPRSPRRSGRGRARRHPQIPQERPRSFQCNHIRRPARG